MTDGGAYDIRVRYSPPWLWLLYLNRKPGPVGGCFVLAFGLVFGGFSGWGLLGEARWAVFGVWADGTATAKQLVGASRPGPVVAGVLFAHGGNRGPRFRVTVDYTDAAGNRQTGTLLVGKAEVDRLPLGTPVRVLYQPADPGRLALGYNWLTLAVLPLFTLAGLGTVAASAVYVVSETRAIGRMVRLVRGGWAVRGVVRRAGCETRGSGRRSTRVGVIEYHYLYRPPEAAEDALGFGRLEVSGRPPKALVVGGPVVVLIDPADPAVHTPDLFDARRADRERLFGRAAEPVSSGA